MRGRPGFLLLMDLDGTMWDHKNVSALTPPFRRVSSTAVQDAEGVRVNLYPDAVEIVRWARGRGALVSSLSWNEPEKALGVLEAFGIRDLFHYHLVENHPRKHEMVLKLLTLLRSQGLEIPVCRILYIDDRTIHLEEMYRHVGRIGFLQAWRDFKSWSEAVDKIQEILGSCP